MKIKILNARLRIDGGKFAVGDIVDVDKGFEKQANDRGLGDMFEVIKAKKVVTNETL